MEAWRNGGLVLAGLVVYNPPTSNPPNKNLQAGWLGGF
jgi:hypothetical protein